MNVMLTHLLIFASLLCQKKLKFIHYCLLKDCLVFTFLAVTWQLYRFTCHSKTLLKNTTKEHSERLVTLETCDQSDKETWPDKQKDNDDDKDKYKDNDNNKDFGEHPQLAPQRLLTFETFDQSDEETWPVNFFSTCFQFFS